MVFDFDMMIAKNANVETPWHQDMSYWLPNLPDKRAISFWIAMDVVTKENGCMCFVPRKYF